MKKMKKSIIILAALAFVATGLFSGCTSSETKISKAEQELQDAKNNLALEKRDAANEKIEDARNWEKFKKESTAHIISNDKEIAELKSNLSSSGRLTEVFYQEQIISLEKRNTELRLRMETFDADKNDWEAFKREFGIDLDNLAVALQDLTVDSNK